VRGGLIGGTLGYNWQLSNVVLGLEGDDAAAWIKGSTVGTLPLPNGNCGGLPPHCDSNLRALGTFRGRVGWAIDRYLPYVTGGLAVGSLHGHEGDTLLNGAVGDGTKTVTGWTLGGGIEAMICPDWSIKAEYLHVDLGKHAVFNDAIPAFPAPVIFAQNVRFTTDVVRTALRDLLCLLAPEPPRNSKSRPHLLRRNTQGAKFPCGDAASDTSRSAGDMSCYRSTWAAGRSFI
jgi:outer membrane immunogenic protein